MRRIALLLTSVLAVGAIGPASATPQVGVQRYLATSFDLHGRDGTRYTFDLVATEAGAGSGLPSTLTIDVNRCSPGGGSCRAVGSARLALPAGAVSVSPDFAVGKLSVTIAGSPLSVSLSHAVVDAATFTIYTPGAALYTGDPSGGDVSPQVLAFVDASGRARLGRASCDVIGTMGSLQGRDGIGEDVRDPRPKTLTLPKSVVTALRSAHC